MSNEEIVQEIQNGINVTENMELLYRQNMPLIRRFIKPYSHYENMEDLEQESYFGLFEATKNYDPNKEAKFKPMLDSGLYKLCPGIYNAIPLRFAFQAV